MLALILGLVVVAMVTFIILSSKTQHTGDFEFNAHTLSITFAWLCGVVALIFTIIICCLVSEVATANVLDQKIAMYQEENATIEQDIDRIVEEYLMHEQDASAGLKTEESSITLVTLFPELKSDTLVQQQLEIYVANNAKIKKLKEEKIDITKLKWLLYFGK